jgi:hypothetical protein
MARHAFLPAGMTVVLFSLFLALFLAGTARADCEMPEVLGPVGTTLGLFTADGRFEDEVAASELVAPAAALACNESLGLLQVRLATRPEPVWVDRAELRLKLAAASSRDVCVVDAGTRATDHRDAVVAGIGDEAKNRNCVPAGR